MAFVSATIFVSVTSNEVAKYPWLSEYRKHGGFSHVEQLIVLLVARRVNFNSWDYDTMGPRDALITSKCPFGSFN
jgi:hypothetical protein